MSAATLHGPVLVRPATAGTPPLDRVGVVLGLLLVPLLVPAGPGNSGIADLGVAAAVVAWVVSARAAHRRLRLPYLSAVLCLVSAGALAILVGGGGSALVLAQDLVLLLWAGAVAAVVVQPGGLALVLRAWTVVGVLSAAVTLVGYATGIALLSGVTAADGTRASATLGDPNLAANWFVLSLLVLRASRYPRSTPLRWSCAALLLVALVLTGSNGGMIALLSATVVGWIVGVARRHGPVAGIGLAAATVVVGVGLYATVPVAEVRNRAVTSIALLNDSVGRTEDSEASRSQLLHEAVALARTEGLLGVGPGATREVLQARQAPYVKEAHDDYLAVVVERGVLGGLGLVLLVLTLVLRLRVLCRPERRQAVTAALPRPELLGCALLAVALSAGLYEVLHFRHVWALFGIVAGLSLPALRRASP